MVSAMAMLCALPVYANDGVPAGIGANAQIAQAQPGGADARMLIGRTIRNTQGESIGDIKSVHINANGKVDLVVVGVGGFLGVGEREVALNWADLQVSDNGEKVVANMTKEQLAGLPPYRYADPKYRGTVLGEVVRPGPRDDRAMDDKTRPRTSGDFNAAGQIAASALVGATVKNNQGETVGTVDDVYVDGAGNAKSVVISVGGFLGVGAHHVSMPWSQLQFQRDKDSLVVRTNATKDALKAMPTVK
jgi:sporulation protein YlmC with PRC-barrel domain